MSDYGDITMMVTEEDIVEVMNKAGVKIANGTALDFANSLLYHLEDALHSRFSTLTECRCMAPVRIRDLQRGFCSGCLGTITVEVSGKRLV